jgi:hypothetical protein
MLLLMLKTMQRMMASLLMMMKLCAQFMIFAIQKIAIMGVTMTDEEEKEALKLFLQYVLLF